MMYNTILIKIDNIPTYLKIAWLHKIQQADLDKSGSDPGSSLTKYVISLHPCRYIVAIKYLCKKAFNVWLQSSDH